MAIRERLLANAKAQLRAIRQSRAQRASATARRLQRQLGVWRASSRTREGLRYAMLGLIEQASMLEWIQRLRTEHCSREGGRIACTAAAEDIATARRNAES